MTGGYALVAWPAKYADTGVMTFIVDRDGIVCQKNLGPGTDAAARAITAYNPDSSWQKAQARSPHGRAVTPGATRRDSSEWRQ